VGRVAILSCHFAQRAVSKVREDGRCDRYDRWCSVSGRNSEETRTYCGGQAMGESRNFFKISIASDNYCVT
jgi:hypothetical protein